MNIAILCNGKSSKGTDRIELCDELIKKGNNVFIGGIYDGKINDVFTKKNYKFISLVASRNNLNPILEIKSIFDVRKKMKQNNIEAVIIYGVKNHPAMCIGAKLGKVKKILPVVNGRGNLFGLKGIKGKIIYLMAFVMLKFAYKISKSICFQNNDDLNFFIKKKLVNKDKCFLTGGSGVNISLFKKMNLPRNNIFLFLSRITLTKGIIEYIEAAKIIKETYQDSIFYVVGPIDDVVEKSCREEVYKANKNRIIDYIGPVKNTVDYYKKCRFFVYPSYYPEGVPRCVLQALSTGRPVITCNTSGCKDTVEQSKNGFLVEPRNVDELVEKMKWMIEHPEETNKMANESRKIAEEKFDINKVNNMIINKL